jgi:GT2 family glycosyltransferase
MFTGDERGSLVRSSRRGANCVSCSSLVSIVIPCYNPGVWLFEAISSAAQQSHPRIEIIVVNDGTDDENSRAILHEAAGSVHVYLEQPNRGLPAARNTGFSAAAGEFVLPLDADDRILPSHIAECVAALNAHPDAAFAYTGYRMFGDMEQIDPLPDYNFHRLLDQNILVYAGLIRREDWDAAGGYDESMRHGYEDWEFWVRLGARGRFGVRVPQALFEYRKHGTSLYTTALAKHHEIVAYIRRKHACLYAPESRARVKAQWLPAVCVVGAEDARHSIADLQRLAANDYPHVLEHTRADAILLASGQVDSTSAEMCALAVWSGREAVRLPDGSQCLSRAALEALSPVDAHTSRLRPASGPVKRLYEHLVNSGLLSFESWRQHPVGTLTRVIPLAVKQRVNHAVGRDVFDLAFYLRFQPHALILAGTLSAPPLYIPQPPDRRRRIALVAPSLGAGAAERMLLELARSLDRACYEILLIATETSAGEWRDCWAEAVDRIYDLTLVAGPDMMAPALYTIIVNWECETVVIQDSPAAYSAVVAMRRERPEMRILDIVHTAGGEKHPLPSGPDFAALFDFRLAVSTAAAEHLKASGTPAERILRAPVAIDIGRFYSAPQHAGNGLKQVLIAGSPRQAKRLSAKIGTALAKLRPARDFRVVVADPVSRVAESDLVVCPFPSGGIPVAALEACAAARPLVCVRDRINDELLDGAQAVLIDPGPGEANRFAAAIHNLLDDPARRAAMGEAGRTLVESRHDPENARRFYRMLFSKISSP